MSFEDFIRDIVYGLEKLREAGERYWTPEQEVKLLVLRGVLRQWDSNHRQGTVPDIREQVLVGR